MPKAERLSREEGVDLWVEYLNDSRVTAEGDATIVDFCGDGTGYFLRTARGLGISALQMAGLTFTWEIVGDPGGRWNSPRMRITPDEEVKGLNIAGLDGVLQSAMTTAGVDWPEPAILGTPQSRGWAHDIEPSADSVCSA